MKHKIILACLLQALGAAAQQPERNPYWLRFLNDASDNPAFAGLNGQHSLAQRWQHSYSGAYLLSSQYDLKYQSGFPGRASGYAARYQYSYEGLFQRQTAALAYAYTCKLNEKSSLSAGLEGSFGYLHFDMVRATFPDQVHVREGTFLLLTTNQPPPKNVHYWELGAGLLFESQRWIAGFQLKHLDEAQLSQLDGKRSLGLFRREYSGYCSYVFRLKKEIELSPLVGISYTPYYKQSSSYLGAAAVYRKLFLKLEYYDKQIWNCNLAWQSKFRLRAQLGYRHNGKNDVHGMEAALVYGIGKNDKLIKP